MTIDEIKDKYKPRIDAILAKVAEQLKSCGFVFEDEPIDFTDEEYQWIWPFQGPKSELLALAFIILESIVRDGLEGGVNFDLRCHNQGCLLAGIMPFNYTPECWVPMKDELRVEERFAIMENNANLEAFVNGIIANMEE